MIPDRQPWSLDKMYKCRANELGELIDKGTLIPHVDTAHWATYNWVDLSSSVWDPPFNGATHIAIPKDEIDNI
jgi:hypothetical protein